jgi:hypothetical protein
MDCPPERDFSQKTLPKPHILNITQDLADCPPLGPELSAPQQKIDFSQDFQSNLLSFESATRLNAMHANS